MDAATWKKIKPLATFRADLTIQQEREREREVTSRAILVAWDAVRDLWARENAWTYAGYTQLRVAFIDGYARRHDIPVGVIMKLLIDAGWGQLGEK